MQKHRIKETTIKGVHYTYYTRTEDDGTQSHPVRLKVIAARKSRFYPIQLEGKNIFMTPDQWGKRDTKQYKKEREAISDAETKAREASRTITQGERPFDFARFEREFLHQESKSGLIKLFENYLEELKSEDRIGTFTAYKNALQAFKDFRGERRHKREVTKLAEDLNPGNLTASILKDFDQFLSRRGCSKATIGMYMRALKVVYNVAANDLPALKEFYPFATKQNDKGKYKIKSGGGSKGETLSPAQVKHFSELETIPGTPEHEAKLLWMFSFYCQGMNFKDIALLKYKDIQWDSIKYVRKKTQDTEATESIMEIPLSEAIKTIIVEIGNPDKLPASHVFPIVRKEQDAEQRDKSVRQKIKMTNKRLDLLCKDTGLPKVTTYAARHSYANMLKQAGESIELIREMLGHSDIRTTEAYLKRFDLNRKKAVNDKVNAILKAS
jgi:integrase/recombinase XerD